MIRYRCHATTDLFPDRGLGANRVSSAPTTACARASLARALSDRAIQGSGHGNRPGVRYLRRAGSDNWPDTELWEVTGPVRAIPIVKSLHTSESAGGP